MGTLSSTHRQHGFVLLAALVILSIGATAALAGAPAAPLFQSPPPVPPPNDNFADATSIVALPYSTSVDMTDASLEPDEPPACTYSTRSVWFRYTPPEDQTVMIQSSGYYAGLAVYTGTALSSLTQVGCVSWWSQMSLQLMKGTTYYLMLMIGEVWEGPWASFSLALAPPPQVWVYYYPSDPNKYDTLSFYGNVYDPANIYGGDCSWDLGDGTTWTGCSLNHRYDQDGDYTVKITYQTSDGRSGAATVTVHVQTHDVAIAKFVVPQSATIGQTRQISVGLRNSISRETVEVQLYKSVAGSYDNYTWVGTLRQEVPVRSTNRTTDFNFSYTFTADDAALGKATFKAVANIVNARDAIGADNTAISLPTKVGAGKK